MRNILKTTILGLLIPVFSFIPMFSKIQPAKAATFEFIGTALAKDNKASSLDLEARKKLLDRVSKNTKSEISGLEDKLNSLDLSDDWAKIKDKFLSDLADFGSYNDSFDAKATDSTTTLDQIKALAKELKDWRETTYTPELKDISNMTFIFDLENMLGISHDRFDKISSDVNKLDSQGIIKTDTLKKYLAQAQKSLDNADGFKNDAKDLFLKSMSDFAGIPEVASSTQQEATSTGQTDQLKKNQTPDLNIRQTAPEIQNSITNSLKDSIKEIKATYDIFFQMNDTIKKYLQ